MKKLLLSCLAVLSLLLTTASFTQVKAAESASTMVEPRWNVKTKTFTQSVTVGGVTCNVSIQAGARLTTGGMVIEYIAGSAKTNNSKVTIESFNQKPGNGETAIDIYVKANGYSKIISFYLTSADFS